MATEQKKLTDAIWRIVDDMTRRQAEILKKQITIDFTVGYQSTGAKPEISQLQEHAITKISTESMGAIAEYNNALGTQLAEQVKVSLSAGKGYEEVKQELVPYIERVFNNEETVEMNHVGQTRTEYYVDRDGKIHSREVMITQPYSATISTYADTASKSIVHRAYEAGRAEGYQAEGIQRWRFSGPADERARISHIALLGNIYTYGTMESDMAMEVLQEYNCRHRAIPVIPGHETSTEFYDKMKEKAGLFWDEDNNEWALKE